MNVKPRQIREGFVDDKTPAPTPTPALESPMPSPDDPMVEPLEPEIVIEKWPIKVRLLYRSIRTDKDDALRELTFREPRGGDINRYGNPVRVTQDGEVVIDDKKMTMIMAALSGINYPYLEAMDPRDWNSCAYRLRSFFLPDPRSW
jgi:hypothetical protein